MSHRFREGASNQTLSCTHTGGALSKPLAHPVPLALCVYGFIENRKNFRKSTHRKQEMDNFTVASCPLKQHSERIWNMTSKCRPWLGSFDNSEPKKNPWLTVGIHGTHFFSEWNRQTIYSTVDSFTSPRSLDSISSAIRHRRDRQPESAQYDSNTISCAVALCFRFFLPFFTTTCQKVLGQFYGAICFSSIFASLLLLNVFLIPFSHVFWSNSFLFLSRDFFVIKWIVTKE